MKKILIVSFFVLTITNSVNASIKDFFSHINLPGDSLKTSAEQTKDTLKNNIADSTKVLPKYFLKPIQTYPLTDSLEKNFISKFDLNKTDYKYAGNFFSYVPFGFVRDLGSPGQPNEILLYGQGFNNSTYLSDGININNRLTNSFNLNLFQSESIDEIETIPLAQGFLYGSNNNPAAVNFISGNFKIDKPYSRIRFFQAANQEGFIDGMFNTTFSRRLGVFIEVTNRGAEKGFSNSEFSDWLGTGSFRYLLTDKINFIASYRYAKSITNLFGGADFDSIRNNNSEDQINEVLYNRISAPVNYINRYQKVTAHNFSFKTIVEAVPNSPTSLTFYYQTGLTEFRQNDSINKTNLQGGIVSVVHNNRYKTIGAQFDQKLNTYFAGLRAIAVYEQNTFTSPLLYSERKINNYSAAIIADVKIFDDFILPSAFGKYLNYDGISYTGLGADLTFKLNDEIIFYGGYSEYEKPNNIYNNFSATGERKNRSIEFAALYENEIIKLRTGFFSQANINYPIPFITNSADSNNVRAQSSNYFTVKDISLNGVNLKFDLSIWKILLSTNTSYYFSESSAKELGIPQFTSNGGIYYIDTLFNSNLKLKAGFNYWSVGSRYNLSIDYEKNISSPYIANISSNSQSAPFIPADKYSPSFQLDFFLAGQIQENAILYFTYENLFDSQYFIVPYYPMPEGSIRFGVAWEFLD